MKISKGWTLIGYVTASATSMALGGVCCFIVVLVCCVWIDMTSWASAWKDSR